MNRLVLVFLALLAGVAPATPPARAGASLSIVPDSTWVAAPVRVVLYVDSAGSPFNAYSADIEWDPQVLQFVSVQPESLWTQYTYLWLGTSVGPDSVSFSTSLMQGGAFVTGPGALASIDFAPVAFGASPIHFDGIRLVLFGFPVDSVATHDGIVFVVDPTSRVDSPVPSEGGPRLEVVPHPGGRRSVLSANFRGSGTLEVVDPSGRLLRRLFLPASASSDERRAEWNVSSLLGPRERGPGVYFVRLVTLTGVSQSRLVLLE